MSRALLSVLLCALAALVLAAPAQAARRLALVIGNDSYANIPQLKNARNDARLVAAMLRRAQFAVTLREDLGRNALLLELERFKAGIQKGDEVVFFFAGHGVQIGANQLLLPVDIAPQSESLVVRDALPLLDVQDALKDARVALLAIDACRDNPFPKQGTRSIGETRGLAPPEPATGQIIVLSAARNQKALDSVPGGNARNSLFTTQLVQALETPNVDVKAALEGVRDRVEDEARKANHTQRPTVVNDLRGNFYIFVQPGGSVTINAPQAQPARPALTAEQIEDQAWADAERADTAAAYEAYLAGYPKGRYAARAWIKLAAAAKPPAVAAQPAPALLQAPVAATASTAVRTERECVGSVCFEMVVVPAGRFMMGSNDGDATERPVHEVSVRSFAIGKTEVTQALWQAVMGGNPSLFKGCGGDCPVGNVSWDDAQQFVRRLSQATRNSYRLPSEAEWEYTCRAGGTHRYCGGDDLDAVAWTRSNSGNRTQRVAGKQPNAWGLYDMSGNVWEWTEDCWNTSYNGAPADGSAWHMGNCSHRVFRGGGWNAQPDDARSALRVGRSTTYRDSDLGFRVARTLP